MKNRRPGIVRLRSRTLLGSVAIVLLASTLLTLAKPERLASSGNVYDQIKRFVEVLNTVSRYYWEDVDPEKLVTGAIRGMLEELDPHSIYIPPKKLESVEEQFQGHFEGIGIEFIIQNKILTVVAPIEGTPSERIGLRPGDQIIRIEGKSAYGITEDQVFKKLRGPRGTTVTVSIRRPGEKEPFDVTITRDKIPIYSVTAAFMLDHQTGYIDLSRFSRTTSREVEEALTKLERQGMKRLLFDVRDNTGGYLDQAVAVADKFIDGGKKIVFTKGRIREANEEFYSSDEATHPATPLIVLVNHGSASASEIVAGAVQDWDRGLVVGETSFGKGLVQNQIRLKDGSALRVTIARYFSPSGRLIQRSYDTDLMTYYTEAFDDEDPNAHPDSVNQRPTFFTASGRAVYGGGGITPDVRIKSRRIARSVSQLIFSNMFFEFGSDYASRNARLKRNFETFRNGFQVTNRVLAQFRQMVKKRDQTIVEDEFEKDIDFIKTQIKREIARQLWGNEANHMIRVDGDPQVQEALKLFGQAAKLAQLDADG